MLHNKGDSMAMDMGKKGAEKMGFGSSEDVKQKLYEAKDEVTDKVKKGAEKIMKNASMEGVKEMV